MSDLSKAFDCIYHNLLIAKLHAHGVEKRSVDFIHSYIIERKGSLLGSLLLFNIFIGDMFFEALSDIAFAVYADDNIPYTYSPNIQTVQGNLREALEKFFQWFSANYLVANMDKHNLLTSSKT